MTTKLFHIKNEFQKVENSAPGTFDAENSAALTYHENSKLNNFTARLLGYNIEALDNEYIHMRASQPYKIYPGYRTVPLGETLPENFVKNKLKTVIEHRRSNRSFEEGQITLKELYALLHYSYGITGKVQIANDGSFWGRRAVPSAGGMFPLEIYILVQNGEIENGLYHFRPDVNALEFLKEGDFSEEIKQCIVSDPAIDVDILSGSALIIITSIFDRVLSKYLERGYRFIMIEVGAVGQSISLISEALGLNSCYAGSFWDDELNSFIGVDGLSESVQAVIAIGKKKE